MSQYWFRVPRPSSPDLRTYLEHLRPLGVRMQRDMQLGVTYTMTDDGLLMDIGDITFYPTTGLIKIWPCAGVGHRERMYLASCAVEAFEKKPARATGWQLRGRTKEHPQYWVGSIQVQVDDDEPTVQLIRRAQHRMAAERELMLNSAKSSTEIVPAATR